MRCSFSLTLEISPDLDIYLLVSQKYFGAFLLQGGICIPQSLTRHTNLFSWMIGCSFTSSDISRVSDKAVSIGARMVYMSLSCFQFSATIFCSTPDSPRTQLVISRIRTRTQLSISPQFFSQQIRSWLLATFI